MHFLKSKFKADPGGMAGALLMAVFAVLAGWRWTQSGRIFFALLLFRDLLWAVFLLVRTNAVRKGIPASAAMAYVSMALPLVYFSPMGTVLSAWTVVVADTLAIGGFLIATLATIELGKRVGVSPAARGEVCRSGVYRWLRHPMYTGYIVAELGWILVNPMNVGIFAISTILYVVRMKAEDTVLSGERSLNNVR